MRIYLSVFLAMLTLVVHGANPDFDHIKGTGVISSVLTGAGQSRTVWLGGVFDPTFFATNGGRLTLTGTVTNQNADTNWVFDGNTLRPQTANSVTTTNLDVWTRFIAKGAVIKETRSRTLSLGTNSLSITTNALLLLDSPTNDASQVVIEIQSGISSGQELTIVNNATNKGFTLYDTGTAEGIQGTFTSTTFWRGIDLVWNGIHWIETGRFDPSGSAPASVNPTIGHLPYNQDGVNFGDSPIQKVTSAPFNVFTNDPGVIVNGILAAHSYLLATTIYTASGDPTGFPMNSDPSFYRMIVTNNAATNRTFTLGAAIYSNTPNSIVEILVEFNGGASLTLSNSGNVLLATNWVPTVQGDRLKLNWNNYNAKWEEQWRYPALASGGGGSQTPWTSDIDADQFSLTNIEEFVSYVPDGASAVGFTLNTADYLTNDAHLLLAVQNFGTNQFTVGKSGSFVFGEPAFSSLQGFFDNTAGAFSPFATLLLTENQSQHYVGIDVSGSASFGDTGITIADGSGNESYLRPSALDTVNPHHLDTWIGHTSGTLFEVANATVNHFAVGATNGIATPQITAYGLVSAAWQLGNATNNVSVLASATNHATATINGVKVAIPYALLP